MLDYGFASLGLCRVEAETSVHNEPSWRLMEHLGMRREGRLREATVEDGKPLDSYLYAIRSEEWRAARLCHAGPVTPKEEEECP
jgi:RimJ/RimL family protein N-acetyltransferase